MKDRAAQLPAGSELLELQLTMMRDAMTFMASGTRSLMQMGMAAAWGKPFPDARLPQARLAAASKDYVLRVQEDVDSILHAWAMAPDAADRVIRAAALGREGPARSTGQAASRAPATPATARRRVARTAGEHAR